jgi:SNF2 family DNA or RNA helicase
MLLCDFNKITKEDLLGKRAKKEISGIMIRRDNTDWFLLKTEEDIHAFAFQEKDEVFFADFLTLEFQEGNFQIIDSSDTIPLSNMELNTTKSLGRVGNNQITFAQKTYHQGNIEVIKYVSGTHLEIYKQNDFDSIKTFIKEPTKPSTNGTYLARNKAPIQKILSQPQKIEKGDRIILGAEYIVKHASSGCIKPNCVIGNEEQSANKSIINFKPNSADEINTTPVFFLNENDKVYDFDSAKAIIKKHFGFMIERKEEWYALNTEEELYNFQFEISDKIFPGTFFQIKYEQGVLSEVHSDVSIPLDTPNKITLGRRINESGIFINNTKCNAINFHNRSQSTNIHLISENHLTIDVKKINDEIKVFVNQRTGRHPVNGTHLIDQSKRMHPFVGDHIYCLKDKEQIILGASYRIRNKDKDLPLMVCTASGAFQNVLENKIEQIKKDELETIDDTIALPKNNDMFENLSSEYKAIEASEIGKENLTNDLSDDIFPDPSNERLVFRRKEEQSDDEDDSTICGIFHNVSNTPYYFSARFGLGARSVIKSEEGGIDNIHYFTKIIVQLLVNDQIIYFDGLKDFFELHNKAHAAIDCKIDKKLAHYLRKISLDAFKRNFIQKQSALISALNVDIDSAHFNEQKHSEKEWDHLLKLLTPLIEQEKIIFINLNKNIRNNSEKLFSKKSTNPLGSKKKYDIKPVRHRNHKDFKDRSSLKTSSLNQLKAFRRTISKPKLIPKKTKYLVKSLKKSDNDSLFIPWHERHADKITKLKQERELISKVYYEKANHSKKVDIDCLKVPVYPYQEMGINYSWAVLQKGFGVLIADDMGLGKTIQSIGLIQRALRAESGKKALLIVPKSLIGNWEREISTFSDLKAAVYLGDKTDVKSFSAADVILSTYERYVLDFKCVTSNKVIKILKDKTKGNSKESNILITRSYAEAVFNNLKLAGYLDEEGKITQKIITSDLACFLKEEICEGIHKERLYTGLKSLAKEKQPLINRCSFSTVVLDEAHRIKNDETERTQRLRNLNIKYKIILSGTPIHNGLTDIHSLMTFLNPTMLGTLDTFTYHYVKPLERAILQIETWMKGEDSLIQYSHYSQLPSVKEAISSFEKLRDIISPFIVRRLKTDEVIISQISKCSGEALQPLKCNYEKIEYQLSDPQQILVNYLYDKKTAAIRSGLCVQSALFDDAKTDKKSNSLNILMQLQQIIDHPLLLKEGTVKEYVDACNELEDGKGYTIANLQKVFESILSRSPQLTSGKLDALINKIKFLTQTRDEKVIVSVKFIDIAKRIMDRCREESLGEAHYLCGNNTNEERQRMVDIFMGKIKEMDHAGLRDILNIVGNQIFLVELKKWIEENISVETRASFRDTKFPKTYRSYKTSLGKLLHKENKTLDEALKAIKIAYVKRGMEQAENILYATKNTGSKSIEQVPEEFFPVILKIKNLFSSKIFILNYKAGGEGVNLQNANHVILFDPSWNPADNSQVAARSYRIGQKKTVTIYTMDAQGDLTERKILEKAQLKAWLAEVTLSPQPNFNEFFRRIYQKLLDENNIIAEMESIREENCVHDIVIPQTLRTSQNTLLDAKQDIIDLTTEPDFEKAPQEEDLFHTSPVLFSPSSFFNTESQDDAFENDFWDTLNCEKLEQSLFKFG